MRGDFLLTEKTGYKDMAISVIKESKILPKDELLKIKGLSKELQNTFDTVQMFRTRTEMETSILNDFKHPTPDSKYWQAVREQNTMFNELVFLSYDYRKTCVELEMLKREIEEEKRYFPQQLLTIEKEKKEFVLLMQERTAIARIKEIIEWSDIKAKLLPNMTASLTDVGEHQLISYTLQWINELSAITDITPTVEVNNVNGKLGKALELCKEKGVLEQVLSLVSYDMRQQLSR